MEEVKKLVFRKERPNPKGWQYTIRISPDAYEIVNGISAQTGKSLAHIVSSMIIFADQFTEVVE